MTMRRWNGTECVAQTENFFPIISIWCGSLFVVHLLHLRRSYECIALQGDRGPIPLWMWTAFYWIPFAWFYHTRNGVNMNKYSVFTFSDAVGIRHVAHMFATENAIFMRSIEFLDAHQINDEQTLRAIDSKRTTNKAFDEIAHLAGSSVRARPEGNANAYWHGSRVSFPLYFCFRPSVCEIV